MLRLSFLSRFILLIVLLLGGISLSAQTWDTQLSHEGIRYKVFITGIEEDAVADSAYVIYPNISSGSITIASSVTYQYTYSKIVGYDAYNKPIYQTFTRVLTCPVKGIEDFAFSGCTGLTSIDIPNSVTEIGYGTFRSCTGLTSINIPNSVTSIREETFRNCTGLTSITIPNSVTSIGKCAFEDCSGLTSINIPNSVTEIGERAFYYCTGLTSIDIPNSVTEIGYGTFEHCTGLTNINIPNSVTYIGERAFRYCTGLTSIDIPNSVTEIGIGTFEDCSGLTNLTIGESVTYIGLTAFRFDSIKELTWNAKHSMFGIGNTDGLEIVRIGPEVEFLPNDFINRAKLVTEVNIPNSVTGIGDNAFHDCWGLTSIEIPKSVTRIGEKAFGSCLYLKKIYWNAKDCIFDGRHDYYPFDNSALSQIQIVIGSEVEYIGDIFYVQYSNIDTVTCYAVVPPIISENCFSQVTYNNAVLCVPRESVEIYRNTKRWQEFFKCIAIETIPGGGGGEELLRGDVDGDGQVTIADVTALIDLLLSGTGDSNPAADVDGDGVVTISDVASLIDLLF